MASEDVRTEMLFNLTAALIHADVGLQAIVLPSQPPDLLTNALHVILGGAV